MRPKTEKDFYHMQHELRSIAAPKPSFKRNEPKRGNHTKFSTKSRRIIIERDEALCVRCRKPYHSIHHIIFASDLGSGTVDNGCCVCLLCHTEAHKRREVREWFERYRIKYLLLEVAK